MLKAYVMLLITTLLIVGAAWMFMNGTAAINQEEREAQERVDEGFLVSRREFNDKKEEFQRRRADLEVQIERLERLKKTASDDFKKSGVKTAEDLENNSDAKRKYQTILQYGADIEKLKGDIVLFDDTISAIESGLRDLDRKMLLKEVGVNDETYQQLRTIVKDIDSKLAKPETALDQLETQANLDAILGND